MEECKSKIVTISPNDSFSSARERINSNFTAMSKCLLYLSQQISLEQNPTQLIFPDQPINNQQYNITNVNGAWIVTEALSSGFGGTKYHLLANELLSIKDGYQHIVYGTMVVDVGAVVSIEPEGALIVL